MKKHILIRILAALGGLVLCALAAGALAETFFHIPVTQYAGQLLGARTPVSVLLTLLLATLLFALGVCCLMMLSGRRSAKRKGFVMQRGENGAIGVSVKSIEGLVQTCVNQHDVIADARIAVAERKDGIIILLDIKEAAGVNIPLAVGALQKQIKQYVNTCTGVDVREVRVMVENTDSIADLSPYAVHTPVLMAPAAAPETPAAEETASAPVLTVEPAAEAAEEQPAEEQPVAEVPVYEPVQEAEELPAEAIPAEEPVYAEEIPAVPAAAVPVLPELPLDEEDDRPLHQRLFGAEEQPVFVPAPPELIVEQQVEELVGEVPVLAVEAAEEAADEEIGANAVLEVVEAVAAEEAAAEELIEDAAEELVEEAVSAQEEAPDEQCPTADLEAETEPVASIPAEPAEEDTQPVEIEEEIREIE